MNYRFREIDYKAWLPVNKFKKYTLLGVLFIVLAGGGYGIWRWSTQRPFDAWNLMPQSPVCILETSDLSGMYQKITQQAFWKNLQSVPFIAATSDKMYQFQELAGQEALTHFLNNRKITTSIHFTSKENIDFVFFVPIDLTEEEIFYKNWINTLKGDPMYEFHTRMFRNVPIKEVLYKDWEGRFSYLMYKDFFIGSYSPVLIEDVVRKIDQREKAFLFPQQRLLDAMALSNTSIHENFTLYLNHQKLGDFFNLATKKEIKSFFQPLNKLATHALMNLTWAEQQPSLRGTTFASSYNQSYFLNVFHQQTPKQFSVQQYIPNNTALCYAFSYDQPALWGKAIQEYCERTTPGFLREQELIKEEYTFNFQDFYAQLEGEMALCILESTNAHYANKLLFLKAQDIHQLNHTLQEFSKKTATDKGLKNIHQHHIGHLITHVSFDDFPEKVFGHLFQGFQESYFTVLGEYIVWSNHARPLKKLLDDVNTKNVWVKKSTIQKNILPVANVTFWVNIPKSWNLLYENSSQEWKYLLDTYEKQFKNFDWFSFQFTQNQESSFQSAFNFDYRPKKPRSSSPKTTEILTEQAFPTPVYTSPYLVKNHNDNSDEVLIQDYSHRLYLLNQDGKPLWKRPGGSPMRSAPTQIDYYQNGKLQYLFLQYDRVSLIDRLGRNVKGFPLYFPDDSTTLETLAVFDFEENKKYHFITSDKKGKVYMFDHDRKKVAGWRPQKLPYYLGCSAQHLKVQNQHYILLSQANGIIKAFNLQGQFMAGFPLNVHGRIHQPLWIEEGLELANTKATCLTQEGILTEFNLLGETLNQKQLYRPSSKAVFNLCEDQKTHNWLIAITEPGKVSILKKSGDQLFKKEFDSKSTKWEVQFFDINTNLRIIAITDKISSKTYLYDIRGRALGEPFQSNKAIHLHYNSSRKELIIYRTYGKKVGSLRWQVE